MIQLWKHLLRQPILYNFFNAFTDGRILTMFLSPMAGQERTEIEPEDIESWITSADAIVVGTFRKGFSYPWWDGWHYQSGIDVTEQLFPGGAHKPFDLRWILPYGGQTCLIGLDWAS